MSGLLAWLRRALSMTAEIRVYAHEVLLSISCYVHDCCLFASNVKALSYSSAFVKLRDLSLQKHQVQNHMNKQSMQIHVFTVFILNFIMITKRYHVIMITYKVVFIDTAWLYRNFEPIQIRNI